MKPTYTPFEGIKDNVYLFFEDEICKKYALSDPWNIPARFVNSAQNLPCSVTSMLEVLGFSCKTLGNNLVLTPPDANPNGYWKKHTKELWGTITSPQGVVIVETFFKPNNGEYNMHSNFTSEGISLVNEILEKNRLARIEWKKSLPWWDVRRYFS